MSFGQSESMLRALSIAFAVATLPLTYWIGRRLISSTAGLVAMLLLAANPLFYYFARETRPYSMLLFFAVASSAAFLHAIDSRTRRSWGLYVLLAVVGLYCHLFLMLTLSAHALFAALHWRTIPIRSYCLSLATVAIFAGPFVWFSLGSGLAQHEWITRPTIGAPFSTIVLFADGRLNAALLSVVVFDAWRRMRSKGVGEFTVATGSYAFLSLWLIAPIAITFVASFVHPIYDERYLVGSIPADSLLVASVAARLSKRWLPLAVALMLIAPLRSIVVAGPTTEIQDWRHAVGATLDQAQGNDAVVVYPFPGFVAYQYYEGRLIHAGRRPPVLLPEPSAERFDVDRAPSPHFYRSLSRDYRVVWVILNSLGFPDPEKEPRAARFTNALRRNFVLVDRKRFKGITVLRYERHDVVHEKCLDQLLTPCSIALGLAGRCAPSSQRA
jgi:mannosyltransferase